MTTDRIVCAEHVWEPPGYWHWHRCSNRAKWLVLRPLHSSTERWPVCGIHVKRYRRYGYDVKEAP